MQAEDAAQLRESQRSVRGTQLAFAGLSLAHTQNTHTHFLSRSLALPFALARSPVSSFRSLARCLSLSLSLSHTHTHTHFLSRSLSWLRRALGRHAHHEHVQRGRRERRHEWRCHDRAVRELGLGLDWFTLKPSPLNPALNKPNTLNPKP